MCGFIRGSAWCAVIAAFLLAGCGKDSASKADEAEPAKPAAIEVAFGDCDGATVLFESGPQPQPFEIEEEEPEEPGGTGTAMVLEEGRMGTRDSAREAGRYAMKRDGVPPQLAREQAIERARSAGILGTIEDRSGGGFATLTGTGDVSSGLDDRDVLAGKGRHGTIGHGSGTGSGHRGASKSARVRIGNTVVSPDLDAGIIRRYLRRKVPRIRSCYEKQLLVKPSLVGTVVARFVIMPDGTVKAAKAEGVDDLVAGCIAGILGGMQFPEPTGGGIVKVRYPFELHPGDAPAGVAGSAGADLSEPYEPGQTNPLRAHEDPIEACLASKKGDRWGVAVVEMTVGDAGAISKVRTHGVDGDLADCITEVAKKATWKTDARAYRCPLSFGPMPVTELASIEITSDEIALVAHGREVVARTPQIATDTTPGWKVPELYQRLKKERLAQQVADPKEVVAVTGPRVLRPSRDTPMKVVTRVYKTALAADWTYLLAAEDDSGWTLLPHRHGADFLPVAPVPRGKGSRWYTSRVRALTGLPDEVPVRLSVLVAPDAIWVGVSRIDDVRRIDKTGATHDWKALAGVLAEHRKGAHLRGRPDIELAAEDDVPYATFVTAVRHAVDAGFDAWTLADPASLSVRFRE